MRAKRSWGRSTGQRLPPRSEAISHDRSHRRATYQGGSATVGRGVACERAQWAKQRTGYGAGAGESRREQRARRPLRQEDLDPAAKNGAMRSLGGKTSSVFALRQSHLPQRGRLFGGRIISAPTFCAEKGARRRDRLRFALTYFISFNKRQNRFSAAAHRHRRRKFTALSRAPNFSISHKIFSKNLCNKRYSHIDKTDEKCYYFKVVSPKIGYYYARTPKTSFFGSKPG